VRHDVQRRCQQPGRRERRIAGGLAEQRNFEPDRDDPRVSKWYRVALQRAGLRPLRFHDLRHTFGTRFVGEAFATDPPGRRQPEAMFDESGQRRLV
jgi:integrase